MEENGIQLTRDKKTMDDEEREIVFSNLEEVNHHESYYLHLPSDSAYGHKTRQIFREEAASQHGFDSIYFYAKQLIEKHGVTTKKNKIPIELTETNFKTLIAAMPSLDAYLSEEQIVALFYQIDTRHKKAINLIDLVSFCLLDKQQIHALLIQYWVYLKRQRLTDTELRETFDRLLVGSGVSDFVDAGLIHAMIQREFDVTLTTGELEMFMQMLDFDSDGAIRYTDFTLFYKHQYKTLQNLLQQEHNAIVDIEISLEENDEVAFKRKGYQQLYKNIHANSKGIGKPLYLWYKRESRESNPSIAHTGPSPALTTLKLSSSSRDTALVAQGFTCLLKDMNRSSSLGKAQYLWKGFASNMQESLQNGIIDVAITNGLEKDENCACLWMPPCRRFIRIAGDLNGKSVKKCYFLWVRTRNELQHSTLHTTPRPNLEEPTPTKESSLLANKKDPLSPKLIEGESTRHILSPSQAKSPVEKFSSIDQLENQVRKLLRRKSPLDRAGCLDFSRLFNEFDVKKNGYLSQLTFQQSLDSMGLQLLKKDFNLLWQQIDIGKYGKIRLDDFLQFLRFTDSGIDEVTSSLQRFLSDAMKNGHDYRDSFREYNSTGDGKLSKVDFQRMVASVQIRISSEEMDRLIDRFDMNKDGIVDYVDFLRFLTGVCDDSHRRVKRVMEAALEIQTWAIEKQSKKDAKEGNIDTSSSWKLLKPSDGIIAIANVDSLLRKSLIRLNAKELNQLSVVIAPTTNGRIDQKSFHNFVNHHSKKVENTCSNIMDILQSYKDKSKDGQDEVYRVLDLQQNGILDLLTLHKHINELSVDEGFDKIDIKDLVYAVQHTGADVAGNGDLFVDHFLHGLYANTDRRHMRYDFVTPADSQQFVEGIEALRAEIYASAKTPDNKYDYHIPFKLFDRNNHGEVSLADFESMLRQLEIQRYLKNSEIKMLMRRFEVNENGCITFTEFRRFASDPLSLAKINAITKSEALLTDEDDLTRILKQLGHKLFLIHKFSQAEVKEAFMDKDSEGCGMLKVSDFLGCLNQLLQNLNALTTSDQHRLVLALDPKNKKLVRHQEFCRLLFAANEGSSKAQSREKVLERLHQEIVEIKDSYDFQKAFSQMDPNHEGKIKLHSFQDALLMAGIALEFSAEDSQHIIQAFRLGDTEFVNYKKFLRYIQVGTSEFIAESDSDATIHTSRGQMDATVAQLQFEVQEMAKRSGGQNPNFSRVFASIDKSGDGYIDVSEFFKILGKLGLAQDIVAHNQQQHLVQFFDTDSDGRINYAEFCSFAKNADKRLIADLKGETVINDEVEAPIEQIPVPTAKNDASVTFLLAKMAEAFTHSSSRIDFDFRSKLEIYAAKNIRKTQHMGSGVMLSLNFKAVLKSFRKVYAGVLTSVEASRLVEHFQLPNDVYMVRYQDFCDMLDHQLHLVEKKLEKRTQKNAPTVPKLRMRMSSVSTSSSFSDPIGSHESYPSEENSDSDGYDETSEYLTRCLKRIVFAAYPTSMDLKEFENRIAKEQRVRSRMQTRKDQGIFKFDSFNKLLKSVYALQLTGGESHDIAKKFQIKRTGRSRYIDVNKFEGFLLDVIRQGLQGIDSCRASDQMTESSICEPEAIKKVVEALTNAAKDNMNWKKMLLSCVDAQGMIPSTEFFTVLKILKCNLIIKEENSIQNLILKVDSASTRAKTKIDVHAFIALVTKAVTKPTGQTKLMVKSCITQDGGHLQNYSKSNQKIHPIVERKLDSPSPPSPARCNIDLLQVRLVDSMHHISQREGGIERVIESFRMFDRYNSGKVPVLEFREVCRQLGLPIADIELEAIVSYFCTDTTGARSIRYQEFLKFCKIPNIVRPVGNTPLPQHSKAPQLFANYEPVSTSFPLGDTKNLHKQGSPKKSSKSRVIKWKCAVCYHQQSSAPGKELYCEMCGSANPSTDKLPEANIVLQCYACAFQNPQKSKTCTMCGSQLTIMNDPVKEKKAYIVEEPGWRT